MSFAPTVATTIRMRQDRASALRAFVFVFLCNNGFKYSADSLSRRRLRSARAGFREMCLWLPHATVWIHDPEGAMVSDPIRTILHSGLDTGRIYYPVVCRHLRESSARVICENRPLRCRARLPLGTSAGFDRSSVAARASTKGCQIPAPSPYTDPPNDAGQKAGSCVDSLPGTVGSR